MQILTFKTAA